MNPLEIKQNIMNYLKEKGPSLPSAIAEKIKRDMIFISAFLSELASEKKIKISHMKVGSSPVYYLEETKNDLEKFSEYLKNKEKEAFMIIKNRGIVEDKNQDPAIRVALRQLKDFAIPFEKEGKIFWRYFNLNERDIQKEINTEKIEKPQEIGKNEVISEPLKKEKTNEEINEISKKKGKKKIVKKKSQKKDDKFFNRVKEFLSKKNIDILDIEDIQKENMVLKVKESNEERILIAFNKKRIIELDIINAYKKSKESNLPHIILSFGEPPKKINNFIEAVKNLSKIYKIE